MTFNLAAHVLEAGQARPDHPALVTLGRDGGTLTHGELRSAILGTARGLAEAAPPGGRILLRLGNEPAFPIAYLGAIAAGRVPVPTSAQLTRPEITAMAAALAPDLVLAGEGVALPDHPAPLMKGAALSALATLSPLDPVPGDPDRPAYIVFTSGTSGGPRAVVHAHRAILGRAFMRDGWEGLGPQDRLLHAGAFNWTYTLGTGLMDPWTAGATALIPAPDIPAEELPALLAAHEATIFAAAPGVFRRMLRGPLPPLPRLRHGLSAGEKLAEPLRTAWREATGTEVHEAYGMSECSTFVSGSPSRPAPPGTLGFPQPGRRIALRHDGAEAEAGTIAVHRSDLGLMLGYLDAPEETAARFDGDWFLTGDLARRTPEGALAYDGRADDMMNAGGYRVSPLEVEAALALHPGIAEAAAVELRPRADTTIIGLFWAGPEALDPAELEAFASARLARYKCPRLYERVAALPRGANNKLDRRRLRQDWEAARP